MNRASNNLLAISCVLLLGAFACGGSGGGTIGRGVQTQTATPSINHTATSAGGQIVTLADSVAGTTIYYTLDGTTPTASSPQYFAPFLVSSNATVTAVAKFSGQSDSAPVTQAVTASILPGSLVWSDEFSNSTGANKQPDPSVWTYDTGSSGFGNQELETYCASGSSTAPCDTTNPNAYVGTDGYLHIVARKPAAGVYTSARLKSQGLFSFSSGRIEARIMLTEGQGLWPAFWMLGNNINVMPWPACGEQDIMEHINAPNPDWIAGSIHATNLNETNQFPGSTGQSFSAAMWHTYGMIWTKGSISYYVDSPSNVYATFTNSNLPSGAVWPFDSNSGGFILLNFAVGGTWPGSPDTTTPFPAEMLVDYVRIYAN
jgi:beta-glucanase (GH16 family)